VQTCSLRTWRSGSLSDTHGSCVEHIECPECNSRDNVGLYEDGYEKCFSPGCGYYKMPDGETPVTQSKPTPRLLEGEHRFLRSRKLSEDTCTKFDYRVVKGSKGDTLHAATYYGEKGAPVAQKIRDKDKNFRWVGDPKQVRLFGQHLWKPGKRIIITEGEIDAMTVSQIQGNKWPVVSVPNGAGGAKRDIGAELEWLEGFEEVVLMFDNDEPGRSAAHECAELFRPGKCRVASLPGKDPNELHVAGRGDEVLSAMWNAAEVRPDGVVSGADLWDVVSNETPHAELRYPWDVLDAPLFGLRPAELVTFCAGSGIGKSAVCREILYSLQQQGAVVGLVALEESVRNSSLGLMGLHVGRPLHLPGGRDDVTDAQFREAYDATIGNGRTYLYDHWGSIDGDHLANKIRAMVKHCGVQVVLLDHISIMVSGESEGDERRLIDNTMTNLRTLAQELDVIFLLVSHLKRPMGTPHEEGGLTNLAQLRGSAAIAQMSDAVVGLERNQQAEQRRNHLTVRMLKNRFAGITGISGYLEYIPETGRIIKAEAPELEDNFDEDAAF